MLLANGIILVRQQKKKWKALEKRVDELERKSKSTSTPLQEIKRALKEALQETKPSPVLFDD